MEGEKQDAIGPDLHQSIASSRQTQSVPETIELPAEKAFYLQRTQVLHDLQGELLAWAKGRFWVISLVFVGVGILGGTSLLSTLVETRVSQKVDLEVARYESKLAELRDTTAVAKEATGHAADAANQLTTRMSQFAERQESLESQAALLTDQLSKLSKSGLDVSGGLQSQLRELAAIVADLVKHNTDANRDHDLANRVNAIQNNAATSQGKIEKKAEVAALSKYPILLRDFPGADTVQSELEQKGYAVSLEHTTDSIADRPGIGIAEGTPLENARDIIQTSRRQWPMMQYVYPRDIGSGTTSLIGGMKTWLDARGYRALTDEEITRLLASTSSEDFFANLRKFAKPWKK